jgi:hypothetical protein
MAIEIHANNAGLKVEEVKYADLVAEHGEPCISIYTSDCSALNGARHCLPRLMSLLRTADPRLKEVSMTAEEAEGLLTSNWRPIEETEPPFSLAQGLAIFMSRDFFGFCHLPVSVASHVAVGRQFLLRPLLPFIPIEDRFFVLALSQNHVRLFEGSRRGIHERTMHEVPGSLRQDLEGLHFERQYQMHTAASLGTHQKGAVFHGPSISQKDRLIHFFRDVDRGVADSLKGQEKPLIVAAVDYLFPIYKEANTYPYLLDEVIDGSPDLLSPNTLHDAAGKILQGQAAKACTRAFSVYNEHVNTPLTSSNLRDVLAAAERGIVRFLFVPTTGERWGSLVPPATVHLHSKEEPGDVDLLNLAAILTIRHGGHVYVVPAAKLPEGADLAAVFRFGFESHVAGAL